MKPLHGAFTRLRRCKCCQGKHTKRTRLNTGKSAARFIAKLDIRARLKEGV